MKISKELIEKYHRGQCSDAERAAVEDWLFSDDADEAVSWDTPDEKAAVQAEMWSDISAILPGAPELSVPQVKPTIIRSFWKPAVAACLLAALGSVLYTVQHRSIRQEIITLDNISGTENKDLNEKEFTLSIAPQSNVAINSKTGMMDFCGVVLINPKEDIELTIQGSCANPTQNREKISLKKGQNYIALNYGGTAQNATSTVDAATSGNPAGEVIVLEEGAMASLPPLVLKQLMHQFNI